MKDSHMAIAIMGDSLPPILDGVTRVIQNYAIELESQGNTVYIAGPKAPGTSELFQCKTFLHPAIYPKFIAPYPLVLPLSRYHLGKSLKKNPPAIIHAHSPFSMGISAHKIAKKLGIPSIITVHSRYKQDIFAKTRSTTITNLITKKIVRCISQFSEVWVPTPGVAEELASYGYTGSVTVIPNAIDFPIANHDQLGLLKPKGRALYNSAPDELTCLFVGQHRKDKGVFTILEALRMLDKSIPFNMIFIGDGPAKSSMKSIIEAYNIAHKVILMDPVSDRETIKQLYAGADLFLFPSEYDTDGIVLKEAAAMGTPSILLKDSLSASSGLYKENETAFLINNDPADLAKKIKTIVANRELLEYVSIQAQQIIPKTWSTSILEVSENYKRVIREFYS